MTFPIDCQALLNRLRDADGADRVRLLLELSNQLKTTDKLQACRWIDEARRMVDREGSVDEFSALRESVLSAACRLHSELGNGATSLELAEEVLAMASGDRARVHAHHLLGMAQAVRGEATVARDQHQRAVDLQQALDDDPPLLAECMFGLAGATLQLGDLAGGLKIAESALAIAREHAALAVAARLAFVIGQAQSGLGESLAALSSFDHALRDARSTGDLWLEARIEGQTGRVHSVMGDHAAALEKCGRALSMTRAHGDVVMTNALLLLMSDACTVMDANEQGATYLRELLVNCEETGNLYYESQAWCRLAHFQSQQGELDEALESAHRALDVADRAANQGERTKAQLALGAVRQSMKSYEAAHAHFDLVLEWSREHGDAWSEIHALLHKAEVCIDQRDFDAAINLAAQVLKGSTYDRSLARAHGRLADAYEGLGDLANALHHLKLNHALVSKTAKTNEKDRLEVARVQQELTQARRDADRAVERGEANYRALVEHSPYVIHQLAVDGNVISTNPAGRLLLDLAPDVEASGVAHLRAIKAGWERDRVGVLFEEACRGRSNEFQFKSGAGAFFDGCFVPIEDAAGRVRRVLFLGLDVTARIEAERERGRLLREQAESQRLAVIGRLAATVAHDFNNYLTSLLFRPRLIENEFEGPVPAAVDKHLREIESTVTSAAGVTRQLLTFSRQQVVRPQVIVCDDVIRGLKSVLELSLPENVQLEFELISGAAAIRMDPSHLEQVVLNLVLNARDALVSAGQITVVTRLMTSGDDEHTQASALLSKTPCVLLEVRDTGPGIDPEIIPHLFEPFFTTKSLTQGTGLGLATVHSVVQQSGGVVSVNSQLGVGTTFRIYLPMTLATVVRPRAEGPSQAADTSGGEGVLLCEDDREIRLGVEKVLQSAGYEVYSAACPSEALELVQARPASIDLLVTDVVLPEMSGIDLAEELRRRRPGLEVLFVSGYATNEAFLAEISGGEHRYLEKPFSPNDLLDAVRETIDAQRRVTDPG